MNAIASDDKIIKVLKEVKEGKSVHEISNRHNISEAMIYRWARTAGVVVRVKRDWLKIKEILEK